MVIKVIPAGQSSHTTRAPTFLEEGPTGAFYSQALLLLF